MDFYVLIQVSPLSEAKSTTRDRTNIGSFIGVNPEVVEEIVPFPEHFPTITVVTRKHLRYPTCLKTGIFDH